MPQINEYMPQTEAQGAIGTTSPNIELAGAVGRGMERLGSVAEGVGEEVHRRTAQEQTANAYSQVSDVWSKWNENIVQQTQDGTLDIQKVKEGMQDDLGKLQDGIDTPEARNALTRASARAQGAILRHAVAGQTQIARNAAQGAFQNFVKNGTLQVEAHPDQLNDFHAQAQDYIDQQIKQNGLPEIMREKAIQEVSKEYITAAVRGYNKADPDKTLKLLNSGELDETQSGVPLLDSNLKAQLVNETHAAQRDKEIEGARADKAVERAYKAHFNLLMNGGNGQQGWYQKITDGTLRPEDVRSNKTIGWQQKQDAINMIAKANDDKYKENPGDTLDAWTRIHDVNSPNPLTDESQLVHEYPNMPAHTKQILSNQMLKTPEGDARKAKEAELRGLAQELTFTDPMNGRAAPESKTLAKNFLTDYTVAKSKLIKDGQDPDQLLDKNSPLYWGNQLNNYRVKDPYAYLAQQRTTRTFHQTDQDQLAGQRPPPSGPQADQGPPSNPNMPQVPPAPQPATGGGAQGTPPDQGNPLADQNARGAKDTLSQVGLGQSDEAKKRHKDKEDQWAADHPGYVQDYLRTNPAKLKDAPLNDRMWRPGESIEDLNKRLGIGGSGPAGPIK